jgi:glutamate--cysteine ligase
VGVREQLDPMIIAAAEQGITLLSVGIDPVNDVSSVPLQLDADRYRRMDAFFNRIGPSGARMMRQTAATQLNLDAGSDPAARWRLLCDLAPYLTAIFANSPRYAGADSGYRSFRAHCWRTLDASRTGIPAHDLSACAAYTRFALEALDMMRLDSFDDYRSYGSWAMEGDWTRTSWENHLTTLFPEVRPRGHLELRSIDALAPEWLAAPVVVVCGLAYDRDSCAVAREMLGPADEPLLQLAAERALDDPKVSSVGAELYVCGVEGARRLGSQYVAPHDVEVAEEFYHRYTCLGRSPADDHPAA